MNAPLPVSDHFVDGEVSYWFRDVGLPEPRPALGGNLDVDVAIVGAGYTGLWTAYYLKKAQPDLRIAVLERRFAGYGASGRNGGWLTAECVGQPQRYAAARGLEATVALQREMFRTIDEVIRVTEAEGIDAHIRKEGVLHAATNPAQLARLRESVASQRRYGWAEEDFRLLDAAEARDRIAVDRMIGAAWSPHCARIQPAALARGLAAAVERLGVTIYEGTTVSEVLPGAAVTDHGTVRATHVVRALEGFTASLAGFKRSWLPMFSNMIVTEPLPDDVWGRVGWQGAQLLGDEGHAFAYAQKTWDGRIALGGRAVPYFYGSRWDANGEIAGDSLAQLRAAMLRLLPETKAVEIDHAWAGILGVPRDWCASVGLDRSTGLAWAGGYVGHGVAGTNLAGRTLADLILDRSTDLVRLPWVDRRVRRWEPEPLRWLAVRGLYLAYGLADRREQATGAPRTSWIARAADLISRK